MFCYRAYLDESEEQGTGIFAVGGFIGKATTWDVLEAKWLAALPAGVSYFHATACFGGRDEFECLDIPQRRELLDTLTDLILEHEIFMIGGAVQAPVYREFAPKRLENDFGGNKYTVPFEFAIERACHSLDSSPYPRDIGKQCDFFIERNQYSQSAHRKILALQNDEALWWRNRIGTSTCGTKTGSEVIPMLQVADLAAFFAAKLVANAADGRISWRHYFDKLKNGHRVNGVTHGDENSLRQLHVIYRSLGTGDRDAIEAAIDEVFNARQ
jgi:hypothetical protein